MPTPLEIARSENRNFLLFSDEDLIDNYTINIKTGILTNNYLQNF